MFVVSSVSAFDSQTTAIRSSRLSAIRDTGIGIAARVLPRVFDLFVQERQAIDRAQGGLGLGLTIARNLCERHGGSISAPSDGPGRGSEFIVRLPRANSPHTTSAELTASPARVVAGNGQPSGLRILVVDDNEDSAEMLAEALKAHGHQARVALDASAALRVAEEFVPNIAFLNIGLPMMDGYELAARLRNVPVIDGIRLIALTGYGQESDRQKTRAAGFQHHLAKPVDLNMLGSVMATE